MSYTFNFIILQVSCIILITIFIFTEGKSSKHYKKDLEKKESLYQLFSTTTPYDTVRGNIKKIDGKLSFILITK